MTQKTPVIITGAAGRMGKNLVALALEHPHCCLSNATEQSNSPHIGQDAGIVAGTNACKVLLKNDLKEAQTKGGVVIDFTSPTATLKHLEICQQAKMSLVIGTTGFTPEQIETIHQVAQSIPIVMAPNMSLGVNALFVLTELAAKILNNGYDIEVFEAHHRLKKDAPSGTAVKLAQILAEVTERNYPQDFVFDRNGLIGERTDKEIGMQVMRGGDIVGEHRVSFCGAGEKIELTHQATSRNTFALGALRAAHWLGQQKPGLYDMRDVLGLKNLSLS